MIAKRDRADWIRTSDLLNPIQAHYQAVLQPELCKNRRRPADEANYARLPLGGKEFPASRSPLCNLYPPCTVTAFTCRTERAGRLSPGTITRHGPSAGLKGWPSLVSARMIV